jgi:uncharacterized protein (TIGR04222 family)
MTHEQTALWHRIRDFNFDAENASQTYSKRLARERGWTPVYTGRVIDEYRKFAFLAVAAGHGVSPSKAVDEAWHLHLLYTRNYWEHFCPLALGRLLHHQPSNGNTEEDMKFQNWYEQTLASYEQFFGEKPPADIWPTGPAPKRKRWLPWLAVLPLILAGCDQPSNPLDWRGPEFLKLFFCLYLVCAGLAILIRFLLRTPGDGPPAQDWQLDPVEMATLNGGSGLAFATTITQLVADGSLAVDAKTGRMRAASSGGAGTETLPRAILNLAATEGGLLYGTVRKRVSPLLKEVEASLRKRGLWVPEDNVMSVRWLPLVIASLPIPLAIAKMFVGMERGKPIGFLIIGCVFASALNLFFLLNPTRSRYGEKVLADLRNQNSGLRQIGRQSQAEPMELAGGMALFGFAAMAGSPYDEMHATMRRNEAAASAGGDFSSSATGCGSSGGDGGGGGGGGGCGGCGGGGD